MRSAIVYVHDIRAGILSEDDYGKYQFTYDNDYALAPVSLTMPVSHRTYSFNDFPPFFEGLLPEGIMLEGLLKISKIDKKDYLSQLIAIGGDLVGAVTVKAIDNE
ncbi:HipA N-terminal domain-containing protein [Flavobacterium sp. CLA17]|uniref:HipA N-terminal domain-containing protein n=1 Tax=Flavobacterium sp. CLA17 TaxID=2724135 RepID=UPI0014908DA8|nr:HipA N-terminal domain-containing protein [Flavobacterium sp. CLA17]QSB29243.1 HipA N-terminal domain-containing protein [Flavobacterium sp. CLA17]